MNVIVHAGISYGLIFAVTVLVCVHYLGNLKFLFSNTNAVIDVAGRISVRPYKVRRIDTDSDVIGRYSSSCGNSDDQRLSGLRVIIVYNFGDDTGIIFADRKIVGIPIVQFVYVSIGCAVLNVESSIHNENVRRSFVTFFVNALYHLKESRCNDLLFADGDIERYRRIHVSLVPHLIRAVLKSESDNVRSGRNGSIRCETYRKNGTRRTYGLRHIRSIRKGHRHFGGIEAPELDIPCGNVELKRQLSSDSLFTVEEHFGHSHSVGIRHRDAIVKLTSFYIFVFVIFFDNGTRIRNYRSNASIRFAAIKRSYAESREKCGQRY